MIQKSDLQTRESETLLVIWFCIQAHMITLTVHNQTDAELKQKKHIQFSLLMNTRGTKIKTQS